MRTPSLKACLLFIILCSSKVTMAQPPDPGVSPDAPFENSIDQHRSISAMLKNVNMRAANDSAYVIVTGKQHGNDQQRRMMNDPAIVRNKRNVKKP